MLVFGISAAVFFWRRRRVARRNIYRNIAGDDSVQMEGMKRGGHVAGTRELYDASGEVSDDDDAEESQPLTQGSLGYHSEFLDDESPGLQSSVSQYRDEPLSSAAGASRERPSNTRQPGSGARSPVSADCWEHAEAP